MLRAVINTSIKCQLTQGSGPIGLLATSTICSRATGAAPTLRGGLPANRAYNVAAREKTSPDCCCRLHSERLRRRVCRSHPQRISRRCLSASHGRQPEVG